MAQGQRSENSTGRGAGGKNFYGGLGYVSHENLLQFCLKVTLKICSYICPWILSVPQSLQFPRASISENYELRGTDNIREQISDRIFAQNVVYCLYNHPREVIIILKN